MKKTNSNRAAKQRSSQAVPNQAEKRESGPAKKLAEMVLPTFRDLLDPANECRDILEKLDSTCARLMAMSKGMRRGHHILIAQEAVESMCKASKTMTVLAHCLDFDQSTKDGKTPHSSATDRSTQSSGAPSRPKEQPPSENPAPSRNPPGYGFLDLKVAVEDAMAICELITDAYENTALLRRKAPDEYISGQLSISNRLQDRLASTFKSALVAAEQEVPDLNSKMATVDFDRAVCQIHWYSNRICLATIYHDPEMPEYEAEALQTLTVEVGNRLQKTWDAIRLEWEGNACDSADPEKTAA